MKALTEATLERLKPLGLLSSDRLALSLNKDGSKFHVRIFGVNSTTGMVGHPSSAATHGFPQRIPSKKQLETYGATSWEMDATDTTVSIIDATWPREQIVFQDEESQGLFLYYIATVKQEELTAEITANFKLNKEVPKHDLEVHPDYPLSPYQIVATLVSQKNEGFGLLMEQGTGKTPVAIARICNDAKKYHAKTGKVYKAIVVCPKNVRNNWLNEFSKFSTQCGNVTIMRGGQIRRTKQMIEAFKFEGDEVFSVIIVGYETLTKAWNILSLIEWNLAITDEGHMYKSSKTVRFEYMMKLRDRSLSRLVLTGTPIANTPLDTYALFEFMGKGFSGFSSQKAWREFYGVFEDQSGQGHLVGFQNLPFMQERLARKSYQCTKKEVMPDMPDKTYDILECEMDERQREAYEQAAEQMAVEFENELNSGANQSLIINNILTKLLRLNQITSGFISWDPVQDLETDEVNKNREIEFFPSNPKVEMLIEELKERPPTSKTIIWCCWMPTVDMIAQRLEAAGIRFVVYRGKTSDADREEAVRQFNEDRDVKVFLGNPAAGGIGLNLLGFPPTRADEYDTNADWTVHFAQDWSYLKRAQCEDRNHRRGTRVSIRNTDFCVPGSIDIQIRDRLMKKKDVAAQVADVREILKAVLNGLEDKDD